MIFIHNHGRPHSGSLHFLHYGIFLLNIGILPLPIAWLYLAGLCLAGLYLVFSPVVQAATILKTQNRRPRGLLELERVPIYFKLTLNAGNKSS